MVFCVLTIGLQTPTSTAKGTFLGEGNLSVNGAHTFLEAALITVTLTALTKVTTFVMINGYLRFQSSTHQALGECLVLGH